jgi:MazG family protein
MAKSGREFESLLELVAQLRAEDGCPWDREQTPSTIKRYILEEAYELVEAVEHHAPEHVAEELGDLIFMAIFLGQLYAEQGHFQMDQVLRRVGEKMVRRHPHVFGNREVNSANEVRLNWEDIKRQEKPQQSLRASLDEIPRALPALMRARRTLSRLVRTLGRPLRQDIIRSKLQSCFPTILQQGMNEYSPPAAEILGRSLLLLTGSALPGEIDCEEALAKTLERFCRQLGHVEADLAKEDVGWQNLSEEQELSLWE